MEDRSVRVLFPENNRIPDSLVSDGVILPENGELYLRLNGRVLCCPDTPEGRDLFCLFMNREQKGLPDIESRDGLMRSLLLTGDPAAADKMNGLYQLPISRTRCASVFERVSGPELPLLNCLKELAPVEEQDFLLDTGIGYIVLIRTCDENEENDQYEYSMALIETVKEETGMELRCGIGNPAKDLRGLSESYREAVNALRLVSEFRCKGSVFSWRAMMTEQILSRIPPDQRRALNSLVFNKKNRHLLTGEMKETVEMFFRSDLNLSDTARQMFIHRNTLTYRLEKIRKETGLDLRRFEDACVFRILSEMYEEEQEANNNA